MNSQVVATHFAPVPAKTIDIAIKNSRMSSHRKKYMNVKLIKKQSSRDSSPTKYAPTDEATNRSPFRSARDIDPEFIKFANSMLPMNETRISLKIKPELVVSKGTDMRVICSKCPPEAMVITQKQDMNKLRLVGKLRKSQPAITLKK